MQGDQLEPAGQSAAIAAIRTHTWLIGTLATGAAEAIGQVPAAQRRRTLARAIPIRASAGGVTSSNTRHTVVAGDATRPHSGW